jgi:hypothetical protein
MNPLQLKIDVSFLTITVVLNLTIVELLHLNFQLKAKEEAGCGFTPRAVQKS